MVERQSRRKEKIQAVVEVRCENATATSLEDQSVDSIVCAFGLKTLSAESVQALASEVARILKPGGQYAFLEISTARSWWLGPVFRWYVSTVIPLIGRLCLGDIECYRMLGRYTEAFESCAKLMSVFQSAGLNPRLQSHFYGCATSLFGRKPA
jgi:demethylmenaquinone methyltransferase/2-methoxy-6-polyprenyl-1,4-benzoquinol methylase